MIWKNLLNLILQIYLKSIGTFLKYFEMKENTIKLTCHIFSSLDIATYNEWQVICI